MTNLISPLNNIRILRVLEESVQKIQPSSEEHKSIGIGPRAH